MINIKELFRLRKGRVHVMKKKVILIGGFLTVCALAAILLIVLQPWGGSGSQRSDAVRFSEDYPLMEEDNVFVYISVSEAADLLENGTGIVYLGFPECPWCQTYVVILNMVAQDMGLERIYYASILDERADGTPDYRRIVQTLEGRLYADEYGNPRVFVPFIAAVRDGVIVGHDNESSLNHQDESITSPVEYWTNARVGALMQRLSAMIKDVLH